MISLHFNVSVSLFEFVPLELTVELDVSYYPKCQDQISGRLFYGGWSLRKVFRYGLSYVLSFPGVYSFQERLREGLVLLSEDFGIISL